jgi:hypothetical protein
MKSPTSSVINAPTYLRFKSQTRRKWGILVFLIFITLILLFSSIFESTLKAKNLVFDQLSLSAQAEMVKQVFNPGSILFGLIWLFIIAYSAIRFIHQQNLVEQGSNAVVDINEIETGNYPFGPGLINAGVRNIIIVKNYQGYLRILLPVYPSQKDLYFFTPLEKIDQSICLQTQSLSMHVFCRTKEGIPITFPSVQIQYRFMVNIPGKNQSPSPSGSISDPETVRNYLLRKGNLSDQEIARFYTDQVISQTIRKISLDELNESVNPGSQNLCEERIAAYISRIKQYKHIALRKHWMIGKIQPALAYYCQTRKSKAQSVRSHRKQMHPIPEGRHVFSNLTIDWNVSPKNPLPIIEEKIRVSLARELQKYNIVLFSLELPSWQPAESLVKQKIQETHEKKVELFLTQKSSNNRQVILTSKNACLDSLRQKSYSNHPNPDIILSAPAQQLLAKANLYKIPGFREINETKNDLELE